MFDVEVLARYLKRYGRNVTLSKVIEAPLNVWVDHPGSKLVLRDFVIAPLELWRIRRRYRTPYLAD